MMMMMMMTTTETTGDDKWLTAPLNEQEEEAGRL